MPGALTTSLERDAKVISIIIAAQVQFLALGGATIIQEGEEYTADFQYTVDQLEEALILLGMDPDGERFVVVPHDPDE